MRKKILVLFFMLSFLKPVRKVKFANHKKTNLRITSKGMTLAWERTSADEVRGPGRVRMRDQG